MAMKKSIHRNDNVKPNGTPEQPQPILVELVQIYALDSA